MKRNSSPPFDCGGTVFLCHWSMERGAYRWRSTCGRYVTGTTGERARVVDHQGEVTDGGMLYGLAIDGELQPERFPTLLAAMRAAVASAFRPARAA